MKPGDVVEAVYVGGEVDEFVDEVTERIEDLSGFNQAEIDDLEDEISSLRNQIEGLEYADAEAQKKARALSEAIQALKR